MIFDIIQIVVQDYITKQVNIMLNKIMKPFNLEEYLKNPERKVITRDGKNVRIKCTDAKREYYPILALVDNGCYESPVCYTKNGECCLGQENYYDLFFAPEKTKVEKFDPLTLQPFDKMLSRYYIDREWTCGILSHPYCYNGFNGFIVNSNFVRYCIPYNEETKHLVGTSDDCPEYYKWWRV